MTSFVPEDFLIDLGSTLENYPEINPNSSVNDDVSELTNVFMKTLDKHAPLKPMSRREIKLNAKPWIAKGILISIKTRNGLFKSCYQCQDPVEIEHYKKYRNKLTHIKALAKQQRYDSLLRKNSNNPKKSWSVIREIIDNKSTSTINLPPTLLVNKLNKAYETDSNEFLDHMCKYFANIGSTLAKKVNKAHDSNLKITSKSCLHSFVMQDVTENEVSIAIENLNSNSAPRIDAILSKFVKMAKMLLTILLTKLYNKCLIQEFFPDVFKVSQVIPIPKTTSPN